MGDNHLLLIDLRSKGVNGAKAEKICELASITLNKNTVPGDKSAINPNGLRVGTPAMTSRGLVEADFEIIGNFIARAVDISVDLQKKAGSKKLVDFNRQLENPPAELQLLKKEVEEFSCKFDTI